MSTSGEPYRIIKNESAYDPAKLHYFSNKITEMKRTGTWDRATLIDLISEAIPDFAHLEKNKFLDEKM